MVTTYTTEHIKPDSRFEFWREAISNRFLPLKPERCGDLPFNGSLQLGQLAELPLTSIQVQGQRVTQTSRFAPEHGYLFLNLQAQGSMHFEQLDIRGSSAGSAFLIDSSLPFELSCPTRMTHVCVTIPKERVADRLKPGWRFAGEQLTPHRAADALCLDYLQLLSRSERKTYDGYEAAEANLLDLLVYALNRRHGSAPVPKPAVNAVLHGRAMALIETTFQEAHLSPLWIARRLGLSVRTLQRIFARFDSTPGQAIICRRIKCAMERLADPRWRRESITDIGLGCGFSDLSYFCRTFNRRTGKSPRDYRRTMLDGS